MAAETTRDFEALEAKAQTLMSVFTKAGYDAVAPAIVQPADVFLDVIGESLRARTYVFTDPDGAELCLRPDLTVPTCRLHLARQDDPTTVARYCYNGAAFRFQPQGTEAAHPREFRQVGVERFGDKTREAAEAETIAIVVNAIEKAGVRDWSIRLGDLGLFSGVLDAAGLSTSWKKRLDEAFLKPLSFRDALKAFGSGARGQSTKVPDAILKSIHRDDLAASEAIVETYFERRGIELIGTRTLAEVTEHLIAIAEDRHDAPLDAGASDMVARYVAVTGPARTAGNTIADLLKGARNGSAAALEAYDRRLALLANAGIDLERVTFSAEFGRTFAYYTGLVFEVRATALGPQSPIASGGRYDSLIRAAGAPIDVGAVGAAVHADRLLAALSGGAA